MVGVMNGDGSVVGRALADLMARTLTQHQVASADHVTAMKDAFTTGLMERLEAEIRPTAQRVFGFILDTDEAPDELKALAEAAAGPTHQADFIIQLVAMIGIAFGGLGRLAEPITQRAMNILWHDHPDVPLSPAEAAAAAIRDAGGNLDLQFEAQRSGTGAPQFEILKLLAGEPPGPMDLVNMWRRGVIDQGRLDHGIRQSRVLPEWTDVYHAIRYVPISVADAVQAAVQGHLSYAEAAGIADSEGISAAGFDILYQTAGNPPGPETALDWLNRGIIDEATTTQALQESRLKNKYIPAFLQSRRRLPPERTVVSMVRKGVLTPADGTQHLLNLGFHPVDAAALISEATTDKVQTEKDLAKGEVTQLYATGTISKDQAIRFLGSLRYSAEEANFILGLVDTAIARASVQSAITKIRSLYVAYRVDRTEASSDLDQLGVAQVKRDELLHVWDLERDANAKDLTLTDVRALVRAGLIDLDNFNERVIKLGYSKVDADLLTQLEANR